MSKVAHKTLSWMLACLQATGGNESPEGERFWWERPKPRTWEFPPGGNVGLADDIGLHVF